MLWYGLSLLVFACLKLVSHVHAEDHMMSGSRPSYRDYFYVGGEYVSDAAGQTVMKNQMYVEKLVPLRGSKQPYPLVLIHGKVMTGTTWLNTPDGRRGWASFFLGHGYVLYIVDQATRGRSAWLPGDASMITYSAEVISQRFTATAQYKLWPQSLKQTQWPGSGEKGDAVFDAYYSSTLQSLSNDTEAQLKMKNAGTALLDRIGPAILVTHSQGGLFGWTIADARPHLVKAILAIEPTGPPFEEAVFADTPARAWGLTDIPILYEPAVSSADHIKTVKLLSNTTDLIGCIMQVEPARTLPNLKDIPVLLEVSQSSYHAVYDHCSVNFLRQAGVKVDFLRLEDIGIKGNGHLQMMEKNNLEVAKVLHKWMQKNVSRR